jgi:pimeloyl-ACP methyl ester carboxylesterase
MHGYALNSLMWELQLSDLIKSHTVINVDLRGFGKSSCANEWGGTAMAGDINRLIKHLELNDVAILGFSLSGGVAIRVALEMPDIVGKLILVSSILPSSGRPKAQKESERHRKEIALLKRRGVKAWAEGMGLSKGPLIDNIFKRNPGARPVWDRIIERHNPDNLLCMMEARHKTKSLVNWRKKLKDIRQKTLIVVGEHDSQFIDAGNYLSRHIPNSKMETITRAGHMLNLEKPIEFNDALLRFLSG